MITLYFHWPFCQTKCPYCDFNSFVAKDIDHLRWQKAYLRLLKQKKHLLENKKIVSIFFGGGTPSLATPDMIKTIINFIKQEIAELPESVEITLEANPTSVEASKFQGFREAGINRVSLGIQSLVSENLQFLGRNHSNQEALAALKILQQHFDNYSFDLIYALPNQTIDQWEEELLSAVAFAKGHLSLYQLTIEDNTKFGALKRAGLLPEINENLAAAMFKKTQVLMKQKGFVQYEVSNFAKPGCESQHNLNYWLYGDYLGIGPGAHSRITLDGQKVALSTIKDPNAWLCKVEAEGEEIAHKEVLTEEGIRLEKILMGMRTRHGIESSLVKVDCTQLEKEGLILQKDDRIYTTDKGFIFLDSIIAQLSD